VRRPPAQTPLKNVAADTPCTTAAAQSGAPLDLKVCSALVHAPLLTVPKGRGPSGLGAVPPCAPPRKECRLLAHLHFCSHPHFFVAKNTKDKPTRFATTRVEKSKNSDNGERQQAVFDPECGAGPLSKRSNRLPSWRHERSSAAQQAYARVGPAGQAEMRHQREDGQIESNPSDRPVPPASML
jgi:hypothetical protein